MQLYQMIHTSTPLAIIIIHGSGCGYECLVFLLRTVLLLVRRQAKSLTCHTWSVVKRHLTRQSRY